MKFFSKFIIVAIVLSILFAPVQPALASHDGTSHEEPNYTPAQDPNSEKVIRDSGVQNRPGATQRGGIPDPAHGMVTPAGGTPPTEAAADTGCIKTGPLGVPYPGDLKMCVVEIFAHIANWVMWGMSWFVWMSAKFLNMALAIQNEAFIDPVLVNVGWQIARDTVNMFFILVILVIAISMILGLGQYGTSQTLVSLLISAVLINFSLPLTGIVIDFSNTLGNTFYDKMGSEQDNDIAGMEGIRKRDISVVLVSGFAVQKTFQTTGTATFGSSFNTISNIILNGLMGSILMAIMSFTLLAATALLIMRIIVLWILMILSPLAFFANGVPSLKGYFGTWASKLMRQAFFYPAYMFMLYLVVSAIDGGVIEHLFKSQHALSTASMFQSAEAQAFTGAITSKVNIILGFVFLGALNIAALTVATSMGAYGAGAVMKQWGSVSGQARSLGRRIATSPLRSRAAGAVASGVATTTGSAAGLAGRIPLIGNATARGLARAGSAPQRAYTKAAEERATQRTDYMKTLSPRDFTASMHTITQPQDQARAWKNANDSQRASYMQSLDPQAQVQFINSVHGHVAQKQGTREADAFRKQAALSGGGVGTALTALYGQQSPILQRFNGRAATDITDAEFAAAGTTRSQYTTERQSRMGNLVRNMSEGDLGKVAAASVAGDTDFRRALLEQGKDVNKLTEIKEGVSEDTRRAYEEFSALTKNPSRAVELRYGMPEPQAGASQQEIDAFQGNMNEWVGNMDDKTVSKLDANAIRNNHYLQNAMAQMFSPQDIKRVASNTERAQALHDLFYRDQGVNRSPEFNQFVQDNQRLSKGIKGNAGVRSVIFGGRVATKRDVDTP